MKNVIEKDGKRYRRSFYKVFNDQKQQWERQAQLAEIIRSPRPPAPAQMPATTVTAPPEKK